ncbi:2-dehydro-3-deoxygalactonokinase [Agrobacterium rosae]|uniref:2-dehydro-3-deoxygalactonokinase n=1 Tax=Agrobacterium rosae TaxID=1972867 RepID=A0AAW9FEV5_9HYPH|nr:2-dehydro-3-deoxygalactonokinase [Agrobacterium rosae]MDX8302978.1 2-dehydro-3-deoxygalactonokinase [Agrobacterium rosae]POO56532.1 2-dehydro-3-deoxygalactonokinase [Agrobacterium rosae]
MSDAAFVAVDWGTTSFRLWLMSKSGDILGERRSFEGMTTAMRTGFPEVLASHLAALSAPSGLPVIICGMAGARQGWVEAGYVDVPADLSDVLKGAVRVPGQADDIRILPGLAQRATETPDVMRGEETQLLGALSADYRTGDQLVCMPGTHSKWVSVSNLKVTGFSTFMTGELFDVITKHSILSHAVSEAEAFTGDLPAFRAAVADSYANPQMATNRLFTVRSGQLLHGLSATDAKAKLSGTMIGLEIAGAHSTAPKSAKVVLIASGALGALYKAAFDALSINFVTIDADEAVRHGLVAAAHAIWH